MVSLVFHPDTAQEIENAYAWYQERAEGLGDDFIEELESAFAAIAALPETWPKFGRSCRRFLLGKFPFSIIYRLDGDTVFVLCVMHNSRKPGYWEDRA